MTTPKQETAASEGVRALTKELAEAREELRLTVAAHSAQRALLRRATYPTDCVEFREYISWREALDAHRAKPSPQSPRGESGAIEGILDRTLSGGVKIRDTSPPYETAPTLEDGDVMPLPVKGWGDCRFEHCAHASYSVGCVVRVESAPAAEPIQTSPFRDVAEKSAEPYAAEDDRIVCELMTKRAKGLTETPVRRHGSGPLATAAELADVVRRLDRLEKLEMSDHLHESRRLQAEIRAEREARKL